MGLFSSVVNTALEHQDRKRERDLKRHINRGGKAYNMVKGFAILGVFAAFAILIFTGVLNTMAFSLYGLGVTILVISISALCTLPWVRRMEKKNFVKTSIVFLSLTGAFCVLWIVCSWLSVGLIEKSVNSSVEEAALTSTLTFIKIAFICSLQFVFASIIGNGILKYRKSLVAFQIVAYVSYLILDFYITYLFARTQIVHGGLQFDQSLGFITSKIGIALLVVSLVFMAVSTIVMNSVERKKIMQTADQIYRKAINDIDKDSYNYDASEEVEDADETPQKETKAPEKAAELSSEEKLEKLKNMYDKQLITKEEYEKKKSDILNNM